MGAAFSYSRPTNLVGNPPIPTYCDELQSNCTIMLDLTMPSLNRLPPEVLHIIFHYLDIPDILRMRRVSRYLSTISHSREVWANAYHTAEFVRPPGPFLWQSTCGLEKALVCGFRVDRNLRNGSGPTRADKPTLKMREIRCKHFDGACANLVFGRFLLVGLRNEIRCYDLNIEALDSKRATSIIFRSPGRPLALFRCVSAFDVEGRPFACAVLISLKGWKPQVSIYSIHVGKKSGVTLDLLHQSASFSMFPDSISLGPRVIVIQIDGGHRTTAIDVHTRTEFIIPSINTLKEAAMITEPVPMMRQFVSTSISTSTHVVLALSYFGGDRWKTFFQAFALPLSDTHYCSASTPTSLSPSHRSVISDIRVLQNGLLHDAIVDSSTQDILITIQVLAMTTGDLSECEHGILRLSTDGTITFHSLGSFSQVSHFPYHRFSFHGISRTFALQRAALDGLISALDYDLRPSGNNDNETKVAEYPHAVRCSARRDLLDYDPYTGRICLARYPENQLPLPFIEIVDLAI